MAIVIERIGKKRSKRLRAWRIGRGSRRGSGANTSHDDLFWWWSWRKQVAEEFPGRSARLLRFGSSGKQGGANNEKECSGYAQYPRQTPAQGANAKGAIARHYRPVLAAIKAGAQPPFLVPD
jgi:hypothetical protein